MVLLDSNFSKLLPPEGGRERTWDEYGFAALLRKVNQQDEGLPRRLLSGMEKFLGGWERAR